ncbi:hypothetical protein GGR52DRAFT_273211 [Hypoxylon sp. FL1284]|nr:hypothetical protein GGR52DRAFT_273211 [Hypoxylon sp. FL1284]
MKGRPVDQLVYEQMFPKPRNNDPQNFHTLLHRHLIPEVRQEVNHFYGHLDTQEAKYPGLDYTHRVHRIRLSRFQWHRRLFRAFDSLRLTDSEIGTLTKWEGTKWAKDRFERDSGIVIRDTAFDEIGKWVEPENRPKAESSASNEPALCMEEMADENMEGEDSDGELTSVGLALNQQLRERAAQHEAGDTSLPLDEEWEQWLKNALESGELSPLPEQLAAESGGSQLSDRRMVLPPRMLVAARAGHWDDVPDFLHDVVRYALERETPTRSGGASTTVPTMGTATATVASSARRRVDHESDSTVTSVDQWNSRSHASGSSATRRREYSTLRLPTSEANTAGSSGVRLQRTAQPGA